MVLSTALFDCAPFKTCVCHGVALDENKKKLSKRLKNYPDPKQILNEYGADALRVYMLSSPLLSGGDLAIDRDGRGVKEALRTSILPIWNAFYFFTLYANIDGYRAERSVRSGHVHDRYILAKIRAFVLELEARLDTANIPDAYGLLASFIDVLNNWFIRRNRARFWSAEMDGDKIAAFDTLYTVLVTLCTALAPLMPFLTEIIIRSLTGTRSVHLGDWPDVSDFPVESNLICQMDLVREICSAGMMIRTRNQMRVRQPLRRVTIAHPDISAIERFRMTIADELNVKQVNLEENTSRVGTPVLKVDPKIGRRLGGKIKDVLAAAKAGEWHRKDDGRINVAGVTLESDDYSFVISTPDRHDATLIDNGAGAVMLDLSLDKMLVDEAVARDFVRFVQETRKKLNLHVSDRISITASVPQSAMQSLEKHRDYVMAETLAVTIDLVEDGILDNGETYRLGEEPVLIVVHPLP